ncbi:chemotaxis protein CheW [Bacillus sp. B-jedd]|uniref:chemotaxis protein CheW n=1 Tax=Bacillus sp. B-jedd TaxID=1476857 RepID=UPI00051559F4|nr:chemotaxis protein CheW [Bacillus sp. B-jedd]CEG25890.1 CheW protein [Bacillus sp. B-jedd]
MTTDIKDFKALIFRVGREEYGVQIHQVVSIERMEPVTAYPNRPPHVLGIATIRDVVTPIVDLSAALTGKLQEHSDSTRIIIVQAGGKEIGIVVDAATAVQDIPSESIQQPNLMELKHVEYLLGISKLDGRLIILLDIEKLLEDTTRLDELKKLQPTL